MVDMIDPLSPRCQLKSNISSDMSFLSVPLSLLQSLRKVGQDSTVLLICITVFLSYLPEAGQYSSFFLYLRQVRHATTYCRINL